MNCKMIFKVNYSVLFKINCHYMSSIEYIFQTIFLSIIFLLSNFHHKSLTLVSQIGFSAKKN
jgi:hypothetical protein